MSRIHRNKKRRGVRPTNGDNWQICDYPSKCGGEGLLVQYLDDLWLNGMGEPYSHGDGGPSDVVFDGPFDMRSLSKFRGDIDYGDQVGLNRSEKRFAKFSCGAVLHEDSAGFCSATWFPNTEAGRKRFADAVARLADIYDDGDDLNDEDEEYGEIEMMDEG
jgi:hypothetical protein